MSQLQAWGWYARRSGGAWIIVGLHSGPTPRGREDSVAMTDVERVLKITIASTFLMVAEL